MKKERCTAIVLAAGQGKRMHTSVQKQFLTLHGYPVLYHSLKVFEESPVDEIVLVAEAGELDYCRREIVEKYGFHKVTYIVAGGKERYHSVYEGLKAAKGADYVLIHDGARPFVNEAIIARTLAGARECGACVAGMPVKDTIKLVGADGFATETPERSLVWMIQTPQTFSYELIYGAYRELIESEKNGYAVNVTDDAMVLETMRKCHAKLAEGSYENIKITTPSDLQIAELFCTEKEM